MKVLLHNVLRSVMVPNLSKVSLSDLDYPEYKNCRVRAQNEQPKNAQQIEMTTFLIKGSLWLYFRFAATLGKQQLLIISTLSNG